MARSLEEYISEFAKRARNQLEAEIAERVNQRVKPVKWEGFNSDGKIIVKDGDQPRVARGMGRVTQIKGYRLLYDEQRSVEYRRRNETSRPNAQDRKERVVTPTKLVPRSQIIPIEIFAEEAFVIGDYVVTYTTRHPRHSYDSDILQLTAPATSSGEIYLYNSSREPFCTGNTTYAILAGVVYAQALNQSVDPPVNSFATISGFLNLSASVSLLAGGNQWDVDLGSAFGAVNEAVTLDYTLQAEGGLSGYASYDVEAYYFALPNTIYYYQTNQNEQGENQFRAIDLSTYFSDAIVSHDMWHNFITTIDGVTYAFSIFHVVTGTFSELEDYSSNNPPSFQFWFEHAYGTLTHYWLHLKVNIATGQVESRKTVITKDRYYNNLAYFDDGTQDVFDRRDQVGRDRVAHASAHAQGNSSNRSTIAIIVNSVQDAFSLGQCAYPWYEDLFANSFEGDWLYEWRNLTFASVDATFDNFNAVKRFLRTSFRNNKWVEGFHDYMPNYWNIGDPSIPELYIYEPTEGSNLYNGIPSTSEFSTSINAVLAGLDAAAPITYQDYFGGSVPGAPSDVNTWRRWAQGLSVDGYKGPDFAGQLNEPPSVTTTGDYATDMTRPWFSYNEPDQWY